VRSTVRRDRLKIRLQVEMLSDTSPERRPWCSMVLVVLSEAIPHRGTEPL
jgi:hypothetical protein